MKITYKNRSIEKVCIIASVAEKKYSREMSEKNSNAYRLDRSG